jgi:hypothetical protein
MNVERRMKNEELRNGDRERSFLHSAFCALRSSFMFLSTEDE